MMVCSNGRSRIERSEIGRCAENLLGESKYPILILTHPNDAGIFDRVNRHKFLLFDHNDHKV